MRTLIVLLAVASCARHSPPAPAATPAEPVAPAPAAPARVVFVQLPPPLPLDAPLAPAPVLDGRYLRYSSGAGQILACTPPSCMVIREAAAAPAALRELAATVDFTRFALLAIGRAAGAGPALRAFDGTVLPAKGGGVVELPAGDCPYCGGATPPEPTRTLDVVRIPRVDGELRVRGRHPECPPCDISRP